MAGKRNEGERARCCDRADVHCAGLTVRRLSSERVRELAEEIWTTSTGTAVPARPAPDPRGSRAGASAQAAYQRRRQQEREAWRQGRWWRAGALAGATIGGGLLIGLTVGAWLGWPMALVAALATGWRLRFRASAGARVWRRQAAMQRRTAGVLRPLEREGYLVLHDVTLPGWLASLDHVVVGPTGVCVLQSWQRTRLLSPLLPPRKQTSPWRARRPAAGPLPELRWQAAAIADILADGSLTHVRPLLCIHGGNLPGGHRSVEGVQVATPRQLPAIIRHGSPLQPSDVERATARALELLRPAV
jgi:Nuclease-related domain